MRIKFENGAAIKAATARKRYCAWHKWFAWRPVLLEGGKEWAWLETVERKAAYIGSTFHFENAPLQCSYRPIDA